MMTTGCEETEAIGEFFEKFGSRFPKEMWEQYQALRLRLKAPMSMLRPGSELRPLAAELNETIQRESPVVADMLSSLGRRLYFPKGILAQSAEAKEKAKQFDATIGIACEDGKPMALDSVMHYFNELTPGEALTYAPATGRPDLRKAWKAHLLEKNPIAGRQELQPAHRHRRRHACAERRRRPVRR